MWWGERLYRQTVKDDNGLWHRVLYTREAPMHDVEVRRECQRLLLGRHRGLLLMWGGVAGLMIAMVVLTNIFGYADVGAWLLVPLALAAIPLGMEFQRIGRHALRLSRLGRELCPACAYCIAGVPERAGGLTICPECGAKWRLSQ